MGFELVIDFKPFSSSNGPNSRKQELLSQLDTLQSKTKPQSMQKQEPIREILDEKLERIRKELCSSSNTTEDERMERDS